jgi:plastocyanin
MLRTLTTLLAVLVLALAGCGGDDDEGGGESAATSTPTATATEDSGGGGGGGEGTVKVAAPEDGSLAFEPSELTASAGEIEFEFDNPSTVPHAFEIEDQDVQTDEITGDSATVTANLDAGEYTFFCPVVGHREAGMEGTLTVE